MIRQPLHATIWQAFVHRPVVNSHAVLSEALLNFWPQMNSHYFFRHLRCSTASAVRVSIGSLPVSHRATVTLVTARRSASWACVRPNRSRMHFKSIGDMFTDADPCIGAIAVGCNYSQRHHLSKFNGQFFRIGQIVSTGNTEILISHIANLQYRQCSARDTRMSTIICSVGDTGQRILEHERRLTA